MGRTIENPKLKCSIVVPDPFTGAAYLKHQVAAREADPAVRGYMAMLAVIESGKYTLRGTERDLRADGMDAPLEVLAWANRQMNEIIEGAAYTEKNSFEPPSKP
jgi:hypothetical protein